MSIRVRIALVCVLVLVATLSYAQDPTLRFAEPKVLAPIPMTLPQLMEQYRNAGGHSRARSLVATGDFEPIFIFPLAGSTAGGGGTFFHTASTVVNHSGVPQTVQVYWFPVGGGAANCNLPAVRLQFDAKTWYYWPDMASQVLNVSGLGAIAVAGVDSAGNIDSSAQIDGFSRIWTLIPGASGSVSQSFVAESLNLNDAGQRAYGLEQDASFRTNFGIFNYDTVGRNFTISVVGQNGNGNSSLFVDACNVVLAPAPAGNFGVMAAYIASADGRGLWYGFGSSVDNASGASWSSVAHP